jgi:hypothetical protein
MIAIGFVMMVLNCTPLGCEYEAAQESITTLQECETDVLMNLLEDPTVSWACGEVHRDEDTYDGTKRYFRSGPAQTQD